MPQKTNRGGEGKNTPTSTSRSGPELPRQPPGSSHGIARTERGEDHPADKSRAEQSDKQQPSEGEKAQREAAERQPLSPGEPGGGE